MFQNITFVPFAARVNPRFRMLSNFACVRTSLCYKCVNYPTSEHAYVHLHRFKGDHTNLFECGGVLSSFERLYAWYDELKTKPFPEKCMPNKKFWHGMDGVIAKMAANATSVFGRGVRKALKMRQPTQDVYSKKDDELWCDILAAKALACVDFHIALCYSGDAYLYEFDRGKARETPSSSPWGAYYNKESGDFTGQNVMGRLIMDTRSRLLNPHSRSWTRVRGC